jgi:hypothetical protein
MATVPNALDESLKDFDFPQREAAFFYGLFLRGHSAAELRRDIEIPAALLAKWDRESAREPELRSLLERIVNYRRNVLAIFESLVRTDLTTQRIQ